MSNAGRINVDNAISRAMTNAGGNRRHPSGIDHQRAPLGVDYQRTVIALQTRNKELMAAITRINQGGGSKNKTRATKKKMPPTDRSNIMIANNKIDMDIWHNCPIRPPAWFRYSTHDRSFSKLITDCGLALPPGVDAKEYWETTLVPAVNDKFSYTKSNLIQALTKQYKGKNGAVVLFMHNSLYLSV